MQEFREDWDAYPTDLQGEFVMFVLNLGLKEVAPIADISYLHWVRAPFVPGPTGLLPDAAGNEVLERIEAWLEAKLEAVEGVFAGRLTAAGRREYFLYLDQDRGEELLLEAREEFPDEGLEVRARPDEEWQIYREFLYPGPVEYQRILNQRVVRALRDHEDMVEFPRPVRHLAHFHTEEAALEFAGFLATHGFGDAIEVNEGEEETRPWHVEGTLKHAVDLMTIDRIVMPIFVKARECGGDYANWECEVVRAN